MAASIAPARPRVNVKPGLTGIVKTTQGPPQWPAAGLGGSCPQSWHGRVFDTPAHAWYDSGKGRVVGVGALIPFRDYNPSGTVPFVTVALIVLNSLAFLVELGQGENLEGFIRGYGLTPRRVFGKAEPQVQTRFRAVGPWLVREQRQVVLPAVPVWLTFLTSMFLHGGWMHLIGNMWYLWIFGDNVEDRMGHVKFLIFYLLCGVVAAWTQVLLNANSDVPMVGASGAIAGVLGAYMLAFPTARVSTLVFLGFFMTVVHLPAIVLLGFWFVIQFLSGLETMVLTEVGGGVAWWAHIGGFVAGMVLLHVFQKPPPRRRAYVYYRGF